MQPQMPFASLPSVSFIEPQPVRRRRSRAVGWFVGIAALLGLSIALYRTHALLAAARALSMEDRYLRIERAVAGRLGALTGRDQSPAASIATSTGVVGSNDKHPEPAAAPTPTVTAAPPPSASPTVVEAPSTGHDEASQEAASEEPAPRKGSGHHAALSGKAARVATAKKGKAAAEAPEEAEAPKSHKPETVRLDDDEEPEAPKSLWPSAKTKAAAKSSASDSDSSDSDSTKSSSKSKSKASAEPPPVNSMLNDAMRAASQK